MFFYLSKILGFLILPQGILMILGFTIYLYRKNHTKVKRLSLLMICLTYLFCNQGFVWILGEVIESPPMNLNDLQPREFGILLTGGLTKEDQASIQLSSSSDRLWQALNLYQRGKIMKILITGGPISSNNKFIENDMAKLFLIKNGVKPEHIFQELQAKNTYQNALYTAKFWEKNKIESRGILITSAYHMKRALACFKKQKLQVEPFPCDFTVQKLKFDMYFFVPQASNFKNSELLMKEIAGIIVYKLKGYI